MIKLTRLNGSELVINCDLIETVEETPNTVISLTNGKRYIVVETINEIIGLVVEFKRKQQFAANH